MIDKDKFISWVETRFDDYVVSDNEVMINSPYDPNKDDRKYKLWCNPSGGKKEIQSGCYHCWISGKKGTLIGLVMDVDKCDFDEACELLGIEKLSENIYELMNDVFITKKSSHDEEKPKNKIIELPSGCTLINSLSPFNHFRNRARTYLDGRKIPSDGLYVCTDGFSRYKNRIIIPYYDKYGNLIYFNARFMGNKDPKYLGPPEEIGVGKGDVVYMPQWAPPGETLYITEGEFDAIVLNLSGVYSAAVGGNQITERQMKILSNYKPVICGDRDEGAGENAVIRTGKRFLESGSSDIFCVFPPKGFKDWNELYIKFGKLIGHYVKCKKQQLDEIKIMEIKSSLFF